MIERIEADLPAQIAELQHLRERVAHLEAQLAAQSTLSSESDAMRHFSLFMRHNPAAAWIKDAEGRYVFTNETHQRLVGRDASFILGRTDNDIFDAAVAPVLRANDATVLATNEVLQTVETGAAITSPETRSWLVFKFPLTDPEGKRLVGGMGLDITDQVRGEERLRESLNLQQLLLAELDHRVRNNLASLLTLIDVTREGTTSIDGFAASIRARVNAMSSVHALLSQSRWKTIDLAELTIRMFPNDVHSRVQIHGPPLSVASRQATALGMIVQELVSNSLKYGALAVSEGNVQVTWEVIDAQRQWHVVMRWEEHNGRTIIAPGQPRVGSGLIDGLVRTDLSGTAELTYPPEGARHRFSLQLLKSAN